MIADYTGMTADNVHDFCKGKFLAEKHWVIRKGGSWHELVVPGSTKGLTTVKFEDYLHNVREWSREFLGVVIPTPNERDYQ